jgi:hypothetical protein
MPRRLLAPWIAALSLTAACEEGPVRPPGQNSGDDGSRLSVLDGGGLTIVDGGPAAPSPDQQLHGGELRLPPAPDLKKVDLGPAPPPKPDSGPQPPPPGDYDFTGKISFTSIASTGGSCSTAQYGDFYCDVMLHTQAPYLGADTLTNVHETQHFMAHEHDSSTPAADKLIYYKNGKAAFYPEPKLTTQGITSSIAKQGTTYNTYIASRPTQPLGENIVDEWRAYLTEEIVAIQIAAIKGQKTGVSGLVIGGVEFLYYNAAALHALSTKEPGFLPANPQAVAIFAMLAEETKIWTIDQGVTPGLFSFPSSATAMLAELRTGSGSAPIRATLKSLYGAAWADRVLGIK